MMNRGESFRRIIKLIVFIIVLFALLKCSTSVIPRSSQVLNNAEFTEEFTAV